MDGIDQGGFCIPADGISLDQGLSGPGWLIQSNFGSIDHGNFEVAMLKGKELVHWWHDNSDVNSLWQRGQTISRNATGPGCIIQSNFGGVHGNFEVVVLEGNELVQLLA